MPEIRLRCGGTATLRPAAVADAEKMLGYIAKVAGQSDFLTFGAGQFKTTVEEERKFIQDISEAEHGLAVIAEINGEIAGCLTFRRGSLPRVAHAGEFGVTVDEPYWGQGIGRGLLAYLVDWARAGGSVRKINLKVRTDNTRGIALYEKTGFVREGVLTREVYCGGCFFDAYLMGLRVDPEVV